MSTQKIPMTEIEYNAELLLPKNCSISQLGHFSRTEAGCVTSALHPTPDVQSGIADCWARTLSGHAAATPPAKAMNSRRFIAGPFRRMIEINIRRLMPLSITRR